MSDMADIGEDSVPRLPHGVRLHFDKARETWVLLAPERILKLDDIAKSVMERVDGQRTFGAIVDDLAKTFGADRDTVATDVRGLLASIAERRLLEV